MKKISLKHIAALLAIALLSSLAICFFKTRPPEDLYCEQPRFNSGRVATENGSVTIPHTYRIRNNTPREVNITRVIISCSCVKADYSTKIAPFSTLEFKAWMELTTRHLLQTEVQIVIQTDMPERKEITLVFTGSTQFEPVASQDEINFGTLCKGHPESQKIRISWAGEKPHQKIISTVEHDAPGEITTTLSAVSNNAQNDPLGGTIFNSTQTINFLFSPTTQGTKKHHAQVTLDNGKILSIPINANVLSSSRFSLEKYLLHRGPTEEAGNFTIDFIPTPGNEPQDFQTNSPHLQIQGKQIVNGKYVLEIKYSKEIWNFPLEKDLQITAKLKSGATQNLPIILQNAPLSPQQTKEPKP